MVGHDDDAATDVADNASTLSDGASLGIAIPNSVDFPALTEIGLTLLETDVDANVNLDSPVEENVDFSGAAANVGLL